MLREGMFCDGMCCNGNFMSGFCLHTEDLAPDTLKTKQFISISSIEEG